MLSSGGEEGRLLRSIQIQVWMRMMAWSLERDAGWELLGRAISLSDSKWREEAEAVDGAVDLTTAAATAAAVAAMAAGINKKRGRKSRKKKKKTNSNDDRGGRSKEEEERKKTARDCLVEDVRVLTGLAPYVLPASLGFSSWLRHTLTFGHRQRVPDYGAELFEHFEIDVAETTAASMSSSSSSSSPSSSRRADADAADAAAPSRPPGISGTSNSASVAGNRAGASEDDGPARRLMGERHDRQRAYFASLAGGGEKATSSNDSSAAANDETATNAGSSSTATSNSKSSSSSSSARGKDDALLFKTPVSLTAAAGARTSNPFLGGSARGSYVGSHLGSKLSNITSLFREVRAAPPPPPARPDPSAKARVAGRRGEGLPPAKASAAGAAASSSSATTMMARKKRKADFDARARSSSLSPVKATPVKRRRPPFAPPRATSSGPMFAVAERPRRLPPVIGESPAGRQPGTSARLRPRLRDCDHHPRDAGSTIVAETPQQQRRSARSDRTTREGDPVVAETPQHRQPKRDDGPAASCVLPTNLWCWQKDKHRPPPPPPRHSFLLPDHPYHGRRRQQASSTGHLSPIVKQSSIGASAQLKFGLSPIPNQEDMDIVMAKVARSGASRKKK